MVRLGVAAAGRATRRAKRARKRITPTPDRGHEELRAARRLARAIAAHPRQIRRASFSALPPFSDPAAIASKRFGGFPLSGRTFGILSNGDATLADEFLSEELPEFVNSQFNDAFIAELDVSNRSTIDKQTPNLIAPNNFAADSKGDPISVNAVGDASVSPRRARHTTYDAATRRLRASTRVKPGRHILHLSIFDQGDPIYDSAVFLDRLTLDRRSPCRSGAVKD